MVLRWNELPEEEREAWHCLAQVTDSPTAPWDGIDQTVYDENWWYMKVLLPILVDALCCFFGSSVVVWLMGPLEGGDLGVERECI